MTILTSLPSYMWMGYMVVVRYCFSTNWTWLFWSFITLSPANRRQYTWKNRIEIIGTYEVIKFLTTGTKHIDTKVMFFVSVSVIKTLPLYLSITFCKYNCIRLWIGRNFYFISKYTHTEKPQLNPFAWISRVHLFRHTNDKCQTACAKLSSSWYVVAVVHR